MSMKLHKLPNTFQPRKQLLFIQRRPPSGTGENMREGPRIQNGRLLTAGRVVRKLPEESDPRIPTAQERLVQSV